MKKGYGLTEIIIIIVITSIISALATGMLITKTYSTNEGYTYAQLTKDKNIQEFLNVYSKIISSYYEDVNKTEIINSAINGMTSYLDDTYTSFLDEDKANSLINDLNATYEGIGITIKDNVIVNVIESSPAYKAGLMAKDEIIEINGKLTQDMTSEEIKDSIKSSSDGVSLKINRSGEVKEVKNIKTAVLDEPSISYNIIDSTNIGYLQISKFSNNLGKQVDFALEQMNNISSLIIDLRNDTGGYLEEAYSVAELFLKKGSLVYSLVDKNNKITKYKDKTNEKTDYSIIILINQNTASAAEILTGALKDSYGAILVGKKSYGKGKVQHTYSLESGGLIKYTSSKWLRPNGECIDTIGIEPDYNIENSIEENEDGSITIIDNQLEKAKELLQ